MMTVLTVSLMGTAASADDPQPGMAISYATSSIDSASNKNSHALTVETRLFNADPGKFFLNVYNENSADWDYGTALPVVAHLGYVTVVRTYLIPKNSAWGRAITSGTCTQVWCHVNFVADPGSSEYYNDFGWVGNP